VVSLRGLYQHYIERNSHTASTFRSSQRAVVNRQDGRSEWACDIRTCAYQIWQTYILMDKLHGDMSYQQDIKESYTRFERGLIPVLAQMEWWGIMFDAKVSIHQAHQAHTHKHTHTQKRWQVADLICQIVMLVYVVRLL
jgi:DNA polymerase I-like protein with 3'-5' exonuclease and polymerase domains